MRSARCRYRLVAAATDNAVKLPGLFVAASVIALHNVALSALDILSIECKKICKAGYIKRMSSQTTTSSLCQPDVWR
jgi:hypothetical protein